MIEVASARVVFAGTPDFAVPSLKALIEAGVTVELVLTQPDRPAGRGRKLSQSPVKRIALSHELPVQQPTVLDEEFRASLPDRRPDLLIVVAYGLILPQWMLDWPTIAPINVHASLLPRWRGAAPIQHALLAGDSESGVSIMRMTRGLDSGPVYSHRTTAIEAAETAGQLHDRLSVLGAELLVDSLPAILAQHPPPEPQDEAAVSFAPKIDKRDAVLDWTLTAEQLERRVRAYNSWPVAEARMTDGKSLRVWEAEAVADGQSADPGSVVSSDDGVVEIATADGLLRLKQVQQAGGRVMTAKAYLAAHDLRGTRFVGPE